MNVHKKDLTHCDAIIIILHAKTNVTMQWAALFTQTPLSEDDSLTSYKHSTLMDQMNGSISFAAQCIRGHWTHFFHIVNNVYKASPENII